MNPSDPSAIQPSRWPGRLQASSSPSCPKLYQGHHWATKPRQDIAKLITRSSPSPWMAACTTSSSASSFGSNSSPARCTFKFLCTSTVLTKSPPTAAHLHTYTVRAVDLYFSPVSRCRARGTWCCCSTPPPPRGSAHPRCYPLRCSPRVACRRVVHATGAAAAELLAARLRRRLRRELGRAAWVRVQEDGAGARS
ncbi:hypothetical protein B0H15DRAFT_856507 [Mycena belliarum]|uniref:Uncharacterized protein n=1 Tax=Mycena belliarum TaxID=1033014 RepID=A0AAD6TZ59_9AGAR|nr:hypothetical protein B0H15DRAFT_856507 [Mycena belliae]